MKVTIIQADNRQRIIHSLSKCLQYDECNDSRDMMRSLNQNQLGHHWDFWTVTSLINQHKAQLMGFSYKHITTSQEKHYPDRYITWSKIRVLIEFLQNADENDIVVFLDSDAWIRDHNNFKSLLSHFAQQKDKHGMFSRDPKISYNTFINTGCIVLKNTPYARNFVHTIWDMLPQKPEKRYEWPHEQYFASKLVEENKNHFIITKVSVLNTPCGEIVRHVWYKDMLPELLMDEAFACLANSSHGQTNVFDLTKYIDA